MIGQALAVRAFDRRQRPVNVAAPPRDPVIVSEIKFREIAVQMLLGAVLIDAFHAALEDGIVAFDGVGGDLAAYIFLFAVVHRAMVFELAANFHVVPRFVGHQAAFPTDVRPQDRRNVGNRRVVDMEATAEGSETNRRCIRENRPSSRYHRAGRRAPFRSCGYPGRRRGRR
jgi:hypothetical protein